VLCFGPSQAAAQLEASKFFTKSICDAAGAPTASYGHFIDIQSAKDYVHQTGAPIVVKADGLAAGKGVIVAMTLKEALDALDNMFGGEFGGAGAEVVIEEFMDGEEASYFILCDGTDVLAVGTAQDHKRVGEGDTGPNTGGMGAYSPAAVLTDAIAEKAMNEIIKPTMAEMAKRGTPYQGVLYAGLMIKDGVPRLVEYNARFGDPECQVLMMRLGAQALDCRLRFDSCYRSRWLSGALCQGQCHPWARRPTCHFICHVLSCWHRRIRRGHHCARRTGFECHSKG
jgi:phosphoribosylamine--glycine ligase